MKTLVYPPRLCTADKVAIIAPASPATEKALKTAKASLEFLGLEPVLTDSCKGSRGYLSGSDELRAENINSAFETKDIKGIFCLRGGYGSPRLLTLADYELIRRNPKIFVGYSDITALHTAINKLCGFITFHGPMPAEDYRSLDSFALKSLKDFIFTQNEKHISELKPNIHIQNPPGEPMSSLYPGKAYGILTGGNLSLMAATLSSPYEIDTHGKILFLEDTGEEPYRLDRALTALDLAGKFRDCSGIILGAFSKCNGNEVETNVLKKNILSLIKRYHKPTVSNLKAGHIKNQTTLPLGAYVTLDAPYDGTVNISVRNSSYMLY